MFNKLLILLPFLLFINLSYAKIDCNIHKIYCKIKQLRPKMPIKKAMKLSNAVYKYAKVHNGDPMLAVAIAMQETGLKKRNRQQSIILFKKTCENCKETWKVVKGVTDICMFQFHVNTILYHKINPIRLKNDLNYCIDWHFKLMNIKKKSCKELKNEAWSCYHSKNTLLRKHYIDLVERYR